MRRSLLALALAAATLAPVAPIAHAASLPAVTQPATSLDLPDTPAGRAARAWVDAVESANADTLRHMIETVFNPDFRDEFGVDQHLAIHQSILADPPRFDSVARADDNRVVIFAQVDGEWNEVTIMVSPDEPHGIIGISLDQSDGPDAKPLVRAKSDAAFAAALDNRLNELAADDRFAGAVLVQRGDTTLFQGARGLASRRYNAPNSIDTRFNLGSANKMFTAVSIAQLADAGKLSYDDTVGRHLSDFPNDDIRDKVTIHHLLTHTSGMGSHFTDEFMHASKRDYRTLHDYIPLFESEPLAFEPGEQFSYSNAGFFVLGLIVEAASGQSYYDYVRTHILEPAGMTRTGHFDMDIPVPDLATGYYQADEEDLELEGDHAPWKEDLGNWRENTFLHSIKGGPAGGAFSTCPDMLRFSRALRDGTLVSPSTLDTLTTGKTDMGGGAARYAYGFIDSREDATRAFGHSGGFPGIAAIFRVYPDLDLTLVIFSNAGPIQNIERAIIATLPDLEP